MKKHQKKEWLCNKVIWPNIRDVEKRFRDVAGFDRGYDELAALNIIVGSDWYIFISWFEKLETI